MSRDGSLTMPFADGNYVFALRWAELIKLQEEVDAGPYIIATRLMNGMWRMSDISSTIRLGLIGGGLEPAKALRLVQEYVEARPPMETLALAQGVLGVALYGAQDEPPGEAPGEASGSTTSPTARSA